MKHIRITIAVFFAVVSIASSAVFAQLTSPSSEHINLFVGDIFEVYSADGNENVNWILTQNNDFLEASTGPSFHTRFSQIGDFTLTTESNAKRHTFLISVENRQSDTQVPIPQVSSMAQFDPPIINDRISLPSDRETVKITPMRNDISVIAIDSNIKLDSNSDGDPQNDDDTASSLFRSGGNSIYLWFANKKDTTIRLGALYTNNEKEFSIVDIVHGTDTQMADTGTSTTTAEEQDKDVQITVLKNDNGEVRLGLQMQNRNRETSLLLWNFGDGQQSMLDEPTHTFAKSGQYNVSVEIRDLQSGKILDNVSEDIIINRLQNDTPIPKDTTPAEQSSGGSIFGLIIQLLLTLIASALIGVVVFFIIGKVKKKGFSLEKSLEKAEEVIVKTPKETVSEVAPPMAIHTEEPIDVTPVESVQPPVVEPDTNTPPPPPPSAETPTAPIVEPDVPPAPPVESESPTQQSELQNTQTTPDMPDWLQQNPPEQNPAPPPEDKISTPKPQPSTTHAEPVPTPEAKVTTPQPEPQPQPLAEEPAANVQHDAMQPSVEELQIDEKQAPDWLKQGVQKAEEVGQTPQSPPPEKLQTDMPVQADISEKEQRLKEKKRLKRQRYRQNLKTRKEGSYEQAVEPTPKPVQEMSKEDEMEDMNEPVAFIKVEDIEPLEPNNKESTDNS